MGAADWRRRNEKMERMGHRQMDRSVSLEIGSESYRMKAENETVECHMRMIRT